MTLPAPISAVRRRGALLLILAALAAASPLASLGAAKAHAEDGGSDGGSDGGDGGGSDDGGGGGDSGGSGDHGGNSGSGSGNGSSSAGTSQGGGLSKGGQEGQRDGALAQRLKNRIAPISEVEAIAGRVKPGEIIDIKLYREAQTYVYRVKVMQPSGTIFDIKIDAVSRKLLGTRQR